MRFMLLLLVVFSCSRAFADEALRGYHAEVAVTAPTRLDWIFALANQSRETAPPDWLEGLRFNAAAV